MSFKLHTQTHVSLMWDPATQACSDITPPPLFSFDAWIFLVVRILKFKTHTKYSEYKQGLLNSQFWEEASGGTSKFSAARWTQVSKNCPLTSSEACASRPDDEGGDSDTSDRNCSCNCSDGPGLLCSPWRPPIAGAMRASRERWSWCRGDVLPLIRCHASWSFCTWSAYFETIFSPKVGEQKRKWA